MTTARTRKTAAAKTAEAKEPKDPGPSVPDTIDNAETWAALTASFPDDWVERLPRPVRSGDNEKGRCEEGAWFSADGHYCGGWHARSVHLSYVGHAGITMRLNSILGPGGWEFHPFALGADDLPLIGRQFYARLTIMGVTHWDLADNFSGPQEAYGDALRRCAMRFGIGTYLWSKSDHALNVARANTPDEPAGSGLQGAPPEPEPDPNDPAVFAPNGQRWLNADGKPNPAALAAHQRKVYDTIGVLINEEPGLYNAWHKAQNLPAIRALDTYQAEAAMSYLEELVSTRPPA